MVVGEIDGTQTNLVMSFTLQYEDITVAKLNWQSSSKQKSGLAGYG